MKPGIAGLRAPGKLHYAWVVVAVTFVALHRCRDDGVLIGIGGRRAQPQPAALATE